MNLLLYRIEVEMAPAMRNSAAKTDAGVLQWLKNVIKEGENIHKFHCLHYFVLSKL